jgi:hypothetical protein
MATPYGERIAVLSFGSAPQVLFPIPDASVNVADAPSLAVGLADGRLVCIDPSGKPLTERRCAAAPRSIAWDGAALYVLDTSGEAFALNKAGQVLWSCQTVCTEGKIYLFSDRLIAVGSGRAVSLSLGGEIYLEMRIPGAPGLPAISPAGLAFSCGSDWVLAAYRFERRLGTPRSPSPLPYPGIPDVAPRLMRFDPMASDSGRQLTHLADIEKSLQSGSMGRSEPEAAAYCAAVASRAFDRDLPELERRRSGNPLPRARACELLGKFGSPAYRAPLFSVLESESDSAVLAAACDALAAIGVDPDGQSMAAFLAAAVRPVDEETAYALIEAIEGMMLRSGGAPNEDGLLALVKLAELPYGQTIRGRASAALERISGIY